MDIGVNQRITEIRQKKGLNKRELADILGIPSSIISDIENGKREPSKEFLLSLSAQYSISLNWLYYGVGVISLAEAVSQGKHPLVTNIETLIEEKMKGVETRLSALEKHLKITPEFECPNDTEDEE